MKTKTIQSITRATLLIVAAGTGTFSTMSHAALPVVDLKEIRQSVIQVNQQIAAVKKQIQQYTTQLQQLKQQVIDAAAPAMWVFDQIQQVQREIAQAQATLLQYRYTLARLMGDDNGKNSYRNAYLAQFANVNYYRGSKCFTETGCPTSSTDRNGKPVAAKTLREKRDESSQMKKDTNDAVIELVGNQLGTLNEDSDRLQKVMNNMNDPGKADSKQGMVAAIGYNNQLLAQQIIQTQKLREAILISAQAEAIRAQSDLDKEAMAEARDEYQRHSIYADLGYIDIGSSNVPAKTPTSPYNDYYQNSSYAQQGHSDDSLAGVLTKTSTMPQ